MNPNSQAIPGAAVQLGQAPARFVDEESPLAPLRFPQAAAAPAPADAPMPTPAKWIVGLLIVGGVYLGWKLWNEG